MASVRQSGRSGVQPRLPANAAMDRHRQTCSRLDLAHLRNSAVVHQSNLSIRRTGTAAMRNVSWPVAVVIRSIRSAAALAAPSVDAHTAKDRPDAVLMRKKSPAPFGTPNCSSISSGSRCVSGSKAPSSVLFGFGGPSPVASLRVSNRAVCPTGVRRSPRHLRLRLSMAFKPRLLSLDLDDPIRQVAQPPN